MYRTRKYEIMHTMNTSLDDAVRAKLMDSLHKIITDHGGTVDKADEWGMKEFAYEINHIKKGCCVVVNATTSNEGIHEFERLTRVSHSIVRYMIIKTQSRG